MTDAPLRDNDCRNFSVPAEKRFGALARVAGVFGGCGCNIASPTVHLTHDALARDFGIIDMARSGWGAIARCRI